METISPIITVKDLSKSYKLSPFEGGEPIMALHNISFTVNRGEIFGIIGADGAGKSTIFRILTTLLLPDTGTATVDGNDIVKQYRTIRKEVGYMPGRFSLYQDLSVEENLTFFASLFGTTIAENYHLIKDIYIQLEPFKKRAAGKLSGGMKQKLALCCALIHKPTVLFLDEPTTGVDPVSRKEFWEMLRRLKKDGITILVSTPYMDEAMLCDRIALIQNGSFLKIETPQQIIAEFTYPILAISTSQRAKLLKELRLHPAVASCYAFGEWLHTTLYTEIDPSTLHTWLEEKGYQDIIIQPISPTIEDCFMNLSNPPKQQ